MPHTFRHLSANLQRNPRVSALTLTVYRNPANDTRDTLAFQVPGRSKVYDVTVDRTTLEVQCTCIASTYGNICRHALAVTDWCNGNLEKEASSPMTSYLSGAIRQRQEFVKTEIVVARGEHKGFFLGFGEKRTQPSNDVCNICKGAGSVANGDRCRKCSGSGQRGDKIVVELRYALGRNLVQSEWVNFIVSAPRPAKDGKKTRPTTLWNRLSALSGLSDEAEIDAWYENLPRRQNPDTGALSIEPIPCSVMIGGKEAKPNELCIREVYRREMQSRAATPPPPVDNFNEDDDEIPF